MSLTPSERLTLILSAIALGALGYIHLFFEAWQ